MTDEEREEAPDLLFAEQRRAWMGAWPPDGVLPLLPAALEASHFRSIERFSLGAIRCRRVAVEGAPGRVVCSFFGLPGLPALVFVDAETQVTAHRVERSWTLGAGLMARRVPDGRYGTLSVGVRSAAPGAAPGGTPARGPAPVRLEAWTRVEAFPSRFLARLPTAKGGGFRAAVVVQPLWYAVRRLYVAHHAQAGHACLRAVAAAVDRLASELPNRPTGEAG